MGLLAKLPNRAFKSKETNEQQNNYLEDFTCEEVYHTCNRCSAFHGKCKLGYDIERRQHTYSPVGKCSNPKTALDFMKASAKANKNRVNNNNNKI